MSKAKILGGVVSVEQSRKFAEYENRKVNYTFSIGEGDDAVDVTIAAGELALRNVMALLNGKQYPDTKNTGAAAPKPMTATEVIEKVTEVVPSKPAKATKAKKADPADVVEDKPQISTGEERIDPADDFSEQNREADPISDVALHEACAKTHGRLKANHGAEAGKLVHKVINKYVGGPPKMSADIPQSARPQFLADLDALK